MFMLIVCVVPLKLMVRVIFMIIVIDVVSVLLINISIGGVVVVMNTILFCLWVSRKIIFLGGMDTRVVVKVGLTISRLSFVYYGPCTHKLL